jgi:hypothetical protein
VSNHAPLPDPVSRCEVLPDPAAENNQSKNETYTLVQSGRNLRVGSRKAGTVLEVSYPIEFLSYIFLATNSTTDASPSRTLSYLLACLTERCSSHEYGAEWISAGGSDV